jgi:hypothetical protein
VDAREAAERKRRRLRAGSPVTITLLVALVVVVVGVGGWLAARAVSGVICGSYNSISNDSCDQWHHDTPPAGALPVPPSWEIRWETLDCGSGGCGTRLYVLSPGPRSEGGVAAYLREIQALGWRIDANAAARRGDLHLDLEPASDPTVALLIPKMLAREGFVFVALASCGEGTVCD